MILNLFDWLLATEGAPYVAGIRNPDHIEIEFDGTILCFKCPATTHWLALRKKRCYISQDGSLFKLPEKTIYAPQDRIVSQSVFRREWIHKGEFWRPNFQGFTALDVKVVRVRKENPQSSLFDYDYCFFNLSQAIYLRRKERGPVN